MIHLMQQTTRLTHAGDLEMLLEFHSKIANHPTGAHDAQKQQRSHRNRPPRQPTRLHGTHSRQQVRRLVESQLESHPQVNPRRDCISRLDDHLPAPPSQAPRPSVPTLSPRLPAVDSADTKVTAAGAATNTHNRPRRQVPCMQPPLVTDSGCPLAAVGPSLPCS